MAMDAFLDLCKEFSAATIVTVLILFILGLKGAADLLKTAKADLESWYQKKRGIEKKEETLEGRVSKLEENDQKQIKKLDQIEDSVQQLVVFLQGAIEDRNKRLDELTESHKQAVVAQARASLYKISKDLENCDYITTEQYEIFHDLATVYLSQGGNSIFKNKIIPTIEALPIRNE